MVEASVLHECAKLVRVPQREDRRHRRHAEPCQGGLVHCLVKRMAIEALPGAEHEPTTWVQDAAHLPQSCRVVREEHEPELADHQVEARLREWQLLRATRVPGDVQVLLLGNQTSDCDVGFVQIQPADRALPRHHRGSCTRDNTSAARHVEQPLAVLGLGDVKEHRRPWREQARHQVALEGLSR